MACWDPTESTFVTTAQRILRRRTEAAHEAYRAGRDRGATALAEQGLARSGAMIREVESQGANAIKARRADRAAHNAPQALRVVYVHDE